MIKGGDGDYRDVQLVVRGRDGGYRDAHLTEGYYVNSNEPLNLPTLTTLAGAETALGRRTSILD